MSTNQTSIPIPKILYLKDVYLNIDVEYELNLAIQGYQRALSHKDPIAVRAYAVLAAHFGHKMLEIKRVYI